MSIKKRRASRNGTYIADGSFEMINDNFSPEKKDIPFTEELASSSTVTENDSDIYLNIKNLDPIESSNATQITNKRSATMANKQENGAFDNPFLSASTSEAWRDYVNWQVKATQSWIDQTLRFNQTYGDYVHNQMNENLRLTQEAMKYSVSVADDIKKGIFNLSEKVTKTA